MRRTLPTLVQQIRRLGALCVAGMAALLPLHASATSPDVVISQVYGGGGNTGSVYKNDFIELYNRGAVAVSLNGWSVQYAAATNTSGAWAVTALTNVTLQPGQYYLIQEALGAAGTTSLPTPDATGTIAMSGAAGKVALVVNATALTCGASCATNAAVKDFVGFGTTANNFEGTGPTAAPSNTLAVLRNGSGATDTDSNVNDFTAALPSPRNSATTNAVNGVCGASNGQTLAVAAPTQLCASGTASSVSGAGHPWNWSCAGASGGTTASCSAAIQSYALAFTSDASGTLSGTTAQTIDYGAAATAVTAVANAGNSFQNWTGPGGFTSTANPLVVTGVVVAGTYSAHYTAAVINGVCGSDAGQTLAATAPTNLCASGSASSVSGSGHPWSWTCAGGNGGASPSCSASIRSYTLSYSVDGDGSLAGAVSQTVDHGASATSVSATPNAGATFKNWTGDNGFATTASNPLAIAAVVADQALVAHFKSGFSIFHTNDVHARLTPHKWVINQHGSNPDVFEDVGGAAHLAGKMLSLAAGKPNSLVLDGGDISEGNPVGDMNSNDPGGNSYGNGGMTGFYELMHSKLKLVAGRGNRGIDALVVGNHDVRDISYITNMEHMAGTGVPVISANVRDVACTSAHPRFPNCEHFPPYTTVTVNGVKVGIIGYTTSSAQVGASLASSLTVVDCQWTGSATCNIAPYVNELRNNQGVDIVILLTHDGHSDLVDPKTPVIADTAAAKVPEIAVTGHWHTWSETVWQPVALNYKTIFTESASYMKYIGELQVTGTGGYVQSTQHVLRNSDITPDPDVQAYVASLIATYDNAHPGHPVSEVVGYTADPLLLDNRMKWWSADEYPWNGNNSAGQWITDGMKWKCDQVFSANGGCDLAVEAGGGVRADIPAGPVTYLQVYETFPWADDTYYRINMTGQDILNFLKATNMGAGFSSALDVTAFDGIATSVTMNGQPIGLSTVYKVAINNYMYANPPGSYTWPDSAPLTSTVLVRDSLSEFMRTAHSTPATAYSVGGARYHFNGEYAGGFRAVITVMDDAESALTYDKAFIRLLSATPETLARRGSRQVPADLVNADGSVNPSNRLAEQEMYRSFLGFKTGLLKAGDIIETYGKAAFFGGNPEFVDQEGVYADGSEFKIIGHDDSLAQPASMTSIGAFWNDNYKNHYVKFLAKKTGIDTVVDQFGQTLKIWDVTAYNSTASALPGVAGDVIEITGVPTMENYAMRFRRASAVVSALPLPGALAVSSHVDALPATAVAAVTMTASASGASSYYVSPIADAQVASGHATTNYGTGTNAYVQSSSTSAFGNERVWVKFDLSALPAGLTITGASLQLWDWKSTGVALPVEVRGGSDDSWTEATLNWNNQPAFGTALSAQTLTAGATDLYYAWNVGSFVQTKYSGNKQVSLVVKAATEGSVDATPPSYSFDTKEYGSNAPVLQLQTQSSVASVRYFYRYAVDNANWGAWTQTGAALNVAPYTLNFAFPNGNGFYQFYSIGTDSQGNTESAPAVAQASVQFAAAAAVAQTIDFATPDPVQVGSSFPVSATATSGLAVVFTSQTPGICTVSGSTVSAISVGTCSMAANQAGDAGFTAAPTVVRSFAVTRIDQSIDFPSIGNVHIDAQNVTANVSASSGLVVSLVSQTLSTCTVSGTTVSLVALGTCTLIASQAGSATYTAAVSVSQSFSITSAGLGNDVVVPVPTWAFALLGAGLLFVVRRHARQSS